MGIESPEVVEGACSRARDAGFELSCEPEVGALLSVLAASVPAGGRVLELGTGAGVGLAWVGRGRGGFPHRLLAGGCTSVRDLPAPQGSSFQNQWRKRRQAGSDE